MGRHGAFGMLAGRFLMESVVSKIWSFYCPLRALASVLSGAPHFQLGSTPQYSGCSKKEMGLLDSIPQSWGSHMLTHMVSLSPMGKIKGLGDFSGH